MRSYWIENGPPLNIAILAVASSLGVSFENTAATEEGDLGELIGMIPEKPR